MARVAISLPKYVNSSNSLISAAFPYDTNLLIPTPSKPIKSSIVAPTAPDCVKKLICPSGGLLSFSLGKKSVSIVLDKTPKQFGPSIRIFLPLINFWSSSSPFLFPISPKPALITITAFTFFLMHSSSIVGTISALTAMTAKSTSPGMSVREGKVFKPAISVASGFTGYIGPVKDFLRFSSIE